MILICSVNVFSYTMEFTGYDWITWSEEEKGLIIVGYFLGIATFAESFKQTAEESSAGSFSGKGRSGKRNVCRYDF